MAYYSPARNQSTVRIDDLFALAVGLAILGVFFITLDPFTSLSDASTALVETTGRLASTYIACFILAVASVVIIALRGEIGQRHVVREAGEIDGRIRIDCADDVIQHATLAFAGLRDVVVEVQAQLRRAA